MDLKIAGLCIILAVISENVEARHLTRGRIPSIFGYQDFRFPRTFGLQGDIPGFRQTGLLSRRFQRLGGASNPRRIAPFRSQFGSRRFQSLSALETNDLSLFRRQIEGLSRFPTRPFRLNPSFSSARRRFLPQIAGTRSRLPFLYYGQRRNGRTGGSRSRAIPNDAIRQLRQRFRTTGTGTRDDPIRIISPPSTSGMLQRSSRPQRRPIQLSRARQQLQPRKQEEVIALFGFDQPAGGVPVLSETIDKQTKIKRTPIKKSLSTDFKISKPPGDLKGKEGPRSINISKPITDEFLQKLNVHQLERLATGVAEATKTQTQHEVKQVAKITEEHLVKSKTLKTSTSTDISPISTSPKEEQAKSSINTVIADADSVNININGTSDASVSNTSTRNENIDHANDKNIVALENPSQAPQAVDNIGVPVSATLGEHLADTFTTKDKTAFFNLEPVVMHTNKGQAENFSIDPAGISVIADTTAAEIHSHVDVEKVGSVSSAKSFTSEIAKTVEPFTAAEVLASVENVHVADVVVPVEAAVLSESMAPVESVSVSDIVVPVETVLTTEVQAITEGVPVTDVVISVEASPTPEEVASIEIVPATAIVVPVESTASNEITASNEGVHVTDVVVPIEEAATAKVVASVENVPVTDVVVPIEQAATAKVVASVESAPVIDVVVPVEDATKGDLVVKVEDVPVTNDVVPIASSAVTDVMAQAESVIVSDKVVPVKLSTAATSIEASDTSASKESPVLHVLETKKQVKTASLKEVSSSVVKTSTGIRDPTTSTSSVSLEGKVSAESIVPIKYPIAETGGNIHTNLPIKHVPILGHNKHTEIIPEQHVSVGKSVHHSEISPITTKGILR